jgi:hypothetical protein
MAGNAAYVMDALVTVPVLLLLYSAYYCMLFANTHYVTLFPLTLTLCCHHYYIYTHIYAYIYTTLQPYRTLEVYGKVLPEWVWVAWIPQLLSSLTRLEACYTKTLLRMCAIKYPQSLYYTMRAFLLERRELPTDVPKHLVPQYQKAAAQAVQHLRGFDPASLQLSLNPAAGGSAAANNAAGAGASANGSAQAAPVARAASAPQAAAAGAAAPVAAAAGVPVAAAAALQRSASVPPALNAVAPAAAVPASAAAGQFGLVLSNATGIANGSGSSGGSSGTAPAAAGAAAAPAAAAPAVTSAIVPAAPTASVSSAAPPAAAAAAGAAAAAPAAPAVPLLKMATASNYTDDLMAVLRRAHPALGAEMETVLEEIIVHFRPEPEEELLSTVHALLVKCFQLAYSGADGPMMTTFRSTLAKVYKKFFNTPALQNSPRNKAFVAMYKTAFERDFVSDTCPTGLWFTAAAATEAARAAVASAPGTAAAAQSAAKPLPLVIAALKKWKHLLHCRVRKGQTSCDITLQSCSPYLAQLHCELETWNSCAQANIEIPGQYSTSYTELKPELHARLLRFHSQVMCLSTVLSYTGICLLLTATVMFTVYSCTMLVT